MADTTTYPADLQTEELAVQRRRKMAELLMQQSMQGQQGIQTGKFYVPPNPLSPLVQGLQALAGVKGMERADTESGDIAKRYQTGMADEVRRISAMRRGTTTAPDQQEYEQAADQGTAEPKMTNTGDPRGAIQAALLSQYKPVQQMGVLEHKTYENEQTKVGDREARLHERILALDAAAINQSISREDRAAAAVQAAALRRELQANQQAFAAQQNKEGRDARAAIEKRPIVVTDAAGNTRLVDNQGNTVKDLGPVGKPSAAHEKKAEAEAKMKKDFATVIPNLEEISKDGGLLDQSTGSGAGALVDMGAAFFGKATPGSVAVGKLKPMIDPILKLVPRFEGPQSDKDTASYKEAAGDLGNPAVPNARKKEAAKVILKMYRERQGQFSTSDFESASASAPASPAAPRVVDW